MSKLITKIKEVSKRPKRRLRSSESARKFAELRRTLMVRLPTAIYECTSNAAHDQRVSMNTLVTAMIEHCLDELYKESKNEL